MQNSAIIAYFEDVNGPLLESKPMRRLTKLYPGADSSNRDIIDLLQVVLHIILGHSVQIHPGKGKKREEKRGYGGFQASGFAYDKDSSECVFEDIMNQGKISELSVQHLQGYILDHC